MGIIGNIFNSYTAKQITLRQEALGEGLGYGESLINLKHQQPFHTSTPWMRLSSGVVITKGDSEAPGSSVYDQIIKSGLFDGIGENRWKGSNLALKCILQGTPNAPSGMRSPRGVVGVPTTEPIPGVNNDPNIPYPEPFIKAYGWGYNEEGIKSGQGYVPPPGVTSVDFEYKNDGALAFATINIKAFSAEQFSIIDILYMRPGYTCLLEFGHSQYLDNETKEIKNLENLNNPPLNYLFKDNTKDKDFSPSYNQMAKKITEEKKKYSGNYEGFFGRITKFNWKFNSDGSYDITVKLTGVGDVIQSLKVTLPKMLSAPTSYSNNFTPKAKIPNIKEAEKSKEFICSDIQLSQLNFELYALYADQTILKHTVGDIPVYIDEVEEPPSTTPTPVATPTPTPTPTAQPAKTKEQELKEYITYIKNKNNVPDTGTSFIISDEDAEIAGDYLLIQAKELALGLTGAINKTGELINDVKDYVHETAVDIVEAIPTVTEVTNVVNGFQNAITEALSTNENAVVGDLKMTGIPINGTPTDFTVTDGLAKFDFNDNGMFTGKEYSMLTVVKFGAFLAMLQKICNISDGKDNVLLQFEMVEDISYWGETPEKAEINDNTLLVTYPGNFSANPNVCMIKHTNYDTKIVPGVEIDANNDDKSIINNILHKQNNKGVIQDLQNPSLAMRLSDVYININYIATQLRNLRGTKDDGGEYQDVSILTLINSILSGVSTSLGGLNSFRVLFNEGTSKIQIVSESPILSVKPPSETPPSTFNTMGFGKVGKTEGSFITSFDLNSELTDQMATQISIGAQNNSTTIGGNATSFSSYSKGLIDNLMVEKVLVLEKEATEDSGSITEKTQDKIQKIFDESDVEEAYYQVYNDREFNPESYVETLVQVGVNISSIIMGRYSQGVKGDDGETTPAAPAPFFLPFNMSLEMHGLGGMKIYESFQINGKGLPLSYNPKQIKLIIKSLTHTVNVDGWKTKISTFSQPMFDVVPTDGGSEYTGTKSSGRSSGNSSGGTSGNKVPPPPGTQPPADEKLRIRLTRIMDDGIQTLGMMDVLAEDEKTILYTLATVELPWKGNQNSISCIPTDDYRVKSHIRSKGRKCFWLIGNSQGSYAFDKLYGNKFIRSSVLIHDAPIAPGWLLGCIGPGFKFNIKGNQKGRQKGTGTEYLTPAREQSIQAVTKLVGTLYSLGSYKMEIKNLGGGGVNTLPKTYNATVKTAAKSRNLI
tara:strand:- start:4111 stop:7764 length:3654 start_codon:yes stop_codon:yes gene_type:complete